MVRTTIIICHSVFLNRDDRYKISQTESVVESIGAALVYPSKNSEKCCEEIFCKYKIKKQVDQMVLTKPYGYDLFLNISNKLLDLIDRGSEFYTTDVSELIDFLSKSFVIKHRIIIKDEEVLKKTLTYEKTNN